MMFLIVHQYRQQSNKSHTPVSNLVSTTIIIMPAPDSPPVIVARFLRANNYNSVRKSI